ncbi:MAG TPA: phosphoribosylanthranilate isomerase [Gemmataceae bacterium]|nr:phosphoribosylanthranilate isomerase [Gemmataceae bacterium]
MKSPRIKICGITNAQDASMAVEAGADAIGLNLHPGSKRHLVPAIAQQIAQGLPPFVEAVALFVNMPLAQALPIAERISSTVQWHGDSPPLPLPFPWRFIPAFNIVDAASLASVGAYLERCRESENVPRAVVLDGHAVGQFGGTGQTAPWKLLADFDPGVPVILAGGLTPENVAEAIHIVRPYAVDVASGVESSPGRKDPDKLRRFIDAVRSV